MSRLPLSPWWEQAQCASIAARNTPCTNTRGVPIVLGFDIAGDPLLVGTDSRTGVIFGVSTKNPVFVREGPPRLLPPGFLIARTRGALSEIRLREVFLLQQGTIYRRLDRAAEKYLLPWSQAGRALEEFLSLADVFERLTSLPWVIGSLSELEGE